MVSFLSFKTLTALEATLELIDCYVGINPYKLFSFMKCQERTCVYSDMSGELITSREPPVTLLHGTCVWSLMNWSFTRPVWIFPSSDRHQSDWQA